MQQLKSLIQWSPSHTKHGKEKAPHFNTNNPKDFLDYDASKRLQLSMAGKALHNGIMPSPDEPFIYLDVDVDPTPTTKRPRKHTEIQESLLLLLAGNPTYTEWSPSGHGLHIIYKLSPRDHEIMKQHQITRLTSAALGNPMTGELFFGNGFLIITERPYFDKQHSVATISLETLVQLYPRLERELTTPIPQKADVIGINSKMRLTAMPDIDDLRIQLEQLPTTMTFYMQRAYARLSHPMEPNDYDHWVNVAMCLSHAALYSSDPAIHVEYYHLFDEWSSMAGELYKGSDDTLQKWEQCLNSTHDKMVEDNRYSPTLTKATMCQLVRLCKPQYTDRDNENRIMWESTTNLKTAINFHELTFHADAYSFDSIYVECHTDVADKLFWANFGRHETKPDHVMIHFKSIDLGIRMILESSNYHVPAISKCIKPFKQAMVQDVDLETNRNVHDKFKTFIDSRPWDGHPRVQQVIDTLHFDPLTTPEIHNHFRTGMYKCLLWLVGIRYHGHPASAPTVPILVGREGIYKSTWAKSLMHGTPFAMQFVRPISGLMSDRKELSRALQGTLVALVDEIETVLKNADKAKDVLLEETLSLRAHYTNDFVNVMKRGLLIGTTNNPYMNASTDGNRRLLRITVQHCDTDAMWQIDMQQVYAELKHDYMAAKKAGTPMPWVFTQEENALTNKIMGLASTSSDDVLLLEEYFGGPPSEFVFDGGDSLLGDHGGIKQNRILESEGHAVSVKTMLRDLRTYLSDLSPDGHVSSNQIISRPALKRQLQAYAAKYTDTQHKSIMVGEHKVTDGMITLKKQMLFIVPQRKEEV